MVVCPSSGPAPAGTNHPAATGGAWMGKVSIGSATGGGGMITPLGYELQQQAEAV